MTPQITRSDVIAAKRNDLGAVQKIMDELLPVIDNIARGIGSKTTRSDFADEMAAEGRLKLWEMISEHADDDDGPGPIAGQMIRRLKSVMENQATEDMSPGVNYRATQRYMQCLSEANGDHEEAVRLAQELPAGKRLSKDLAYEVRAAVQSGTVQPHPERHHHPALDAPNESAASPRIAHVRATLNALSDKQATVLREFYMNEKPLELIAEETVATLKQVTDTKTVARKNFHARFPFEAAYGTDEKPPLVAEHSNAKAGRDTSPSPVKARWAASKEAALNSSWAPSGALKTCEIDDCDIPKAPGHPSLCKGHVAMIRRRAVRAVNSGAVVRGAK